MDIRGTVRTSTSNTLPNTRDPYITNNLQNPVKSSIHRKTI